MGVCLFQTRTNSCDRRPQLRKQDVAQLRSFCQSFLHHDSFHPYPEHGAGPLREPIGLRCLGQGPHAHSCWTLQTLPPVSWAALCCSDLAATQTTRWFLNDIPSAAAQGLWLAFLFVFFFLSYLRSSRELKSRPLKAKHF